MDSEKNSNLLNSYNVKIVRNEVQSLYGLTKGMLLEEDSSILSLAFHNYLLFFTIEAINYVSEFSNTTINYNYKTQLKRSRAKIKPYELSIENITTNINNLNYKTMEYFSRDLSEIIKKLFGNMIDNLGIYKYKSKIISNTFLIASDLKHLIYTNNEIDSQKIISSSKTVGELLSLLMNLFGNKRTKICKLNILDKIELKDYNVINKNNKLLKEDIDINIALFILDNLSILNFYNLIIRNFNICDSLKYRIAYVSFYRTFYNLNKLFEKSFDEKLEGINKICKKYSCLDNRIFRNGICHYNITDKLDNSDIDRNEMYLGLIKKYLKIDELTFKNMLNNYYSELSNEIENLILK